MFQFSEFLFNTYQNYKESEIFGLYLRYSDIEKLIESHAKNGIFQFSQLGKSCENTPINCFKFGKGKTKILLWSQMHGDESTGTQAIFDILNLLSQKDEKINKYIDRISQKCTLYFIPMLNPDGAERFIRRNAAGIDINRDALKLASPEAKILMNAVEEIKPDFAFNLHDQDAYYAVGKTNSPVAISFLSPAFCFEKKIDKYRKRAMKVIAMNNKILQNYIPGAVAKYNDDFYPTAFGDNIQKFGASTILIESGWYYNDDDKQLIRKLNFIIILNSLFAISTKEYKKFKIKIYSEIPFNRKDGLFEKIIKHKIQIEDKIIETDVGIRRRFSLDTEKHLRCEYKVEDIGDLSAYFQYIEADINAELNNKISIGDKIKVQ